MDPGDSSSAVAVTDDGAKSLVSSSSFPTQPAPIAVMMQQAIAMQQFQFQQALLMQQVMASQQAAARAATVKSATEMAAARAAEISKMLQGHDIEEENVKAVDQSGKRSKSRSRSRSQSSSRLLSASRSSSKSRSRSRSPLRYRRGRSRSGSPHRYRDNHYSPPHYRDHYGYRGRGRGRFRGYYRGGRVDYSRGYYRRDWNQYRSDYRSHGHRRSRSLSRSRGRRRSRSQSGSPRDHRSGSPSPRHHGERRVAAHRLRRSRSKEPRWSTSRSRSSSISKGDGVRKENPAKDRGTSSPISKSTDASDHQEGHHDAPNHQYRRRQKILGNSSRLERNGRPKDAEHKELPESPLRSLSVTLHNSSTTGEEKYVDEDAASLRNHKRTGGQSTRDSLGTKTDRSNVDVGGQAISTLEHTPEAVSSDRWTYGRYGSKVEDAPFNSFKCKKESSGLSEGGKIVEQIGDIGSSEEEIEDGKGVDDWRDDIEAENVGSKCIKEPGVYSINSVYGNSEEEYGDNRSGTDGGGGNAPEFELSHGDREDDLIYEGPALASNEFEYDQLQVKELKNTRKVEPVIEEREEHDDQNIVTIGELGLYDSRENVEQTTGINHTPHHEYGSHLKRGREAFQAKEEIRKGDESFEKQRERHKKHRRKHRHQNSLEDDNDEGENADNGAVDCEGHRGKKHHSRKHRRDDGERRERKKRRHKT